MPEENKKKQQIALLIAGAIVVGVIGYYYYSRQKIDETEPDTKQNCNITIIEQITYAGDDSITNKMDENTNQKYERYNKNTCNIYVYMYKNKISKSEDDLDDMIDDKPISNNEIKEEKEESQPNDNNVINIEEEKDKSNSLKEESPVIVNKTQEDDEEEPIAIVIKQEEEIEMKTLIQKYDNIADIISKYKALKYKNGKITLKIINMINVDKSDEEKNDVLVKINLPEQKEEISNLKQNNTDNIKFNDQFTLNVNDTLRDVLIISVENNATEIGKVEINIIDIVASKDQCVENREFEVVGSKCGCKVYLNLIYFEDI
eukprot:400347_1